jgi:hypothetical protein
MAAGELMVQVGEPLLGEAALRAEYPKAIAGSAESIVLVIQGLAERLKLEEAEGLAEKLADKGLSLAWGALADAFYGLHGPLHDEVRWLELKTRHAEGGGLQADFAAFEIGCAQRMAGCFEQAVPWLQRAARGSIEEAAIMLGFAYARGEGVAADPLEAVRWFLRSLSLVPAKSPVSDVATWPVQRGVGWRDWALYRDLMRHASPAQRIAITDLIIPAEYEASEAEIRSVANVRRAQVLSIPAAEARWVRVANIGCCIAMVILIAFIFRMAGLHDTSGVVTCALLLLVPLLALAALNL